MSLSFTYVQRERTLVFGAGSRQRLPEFVDQLGMRRIFLVADPNGEVLARSLVSQFADRVAVVWIDVRQHVPEDLAASARERATELHADGVITLGGGSATGLAKALALSHGIPIIALPTTYAGSEQTTIYGVTGNRHKQTGSNPVVLPRVSIYDAELTLDLPPSVTGASAFNALAHCVNGLYSTGANPVTTAISLEGVRAIRDSLPAVMASPRDIAARESLQFGAAMAGITLGDTSTGLHHKICHVLGGTFNLVHADAHSVVLPHSTDFNAAALPGEMKRLADVLGCQPRDVAASLWDLAKACGVPTSLAQLGLGRENLREVAARAAAEIKSNPRPATEEDLLVLLERAHAGTRPISA